MKTALRTVDNLRLDNPMSLLSQTYGDGSDDSQMDVSASTLATTNDEEEEEELHFELATRNHITHLMDRLKSHTPYILYCRKPSRQTDWHYCLYRCRNYDSSRAVAQQDIPHVRCNSRIIFHADPNAHNVTGSWRWQHTCPFATYTTFNWARQLVLETGQLRNCPPIAKRVVTTRAPPVATAPTVVPATIHKQRSSSSTNTTNSTTTNKQIQPKGGELQFTVPGREAIPVIIEELAPLNIWYIRRKRRPTASDEWQYTLYRCSQYDKKRTRCTSSMSFVYTGSGQVTMRWRWAHTGHDVEFTERNAKDLIESAVMRTRMRLGD